MWRQPICRRYRSTLQQVFEHSLDDYSAENAWQARAVPPWPLATRMAAACLSAGRAAAETSWHAGEATSLKNSSISFC